MLTVSSRRRAARLLAFVLIVAQLVQLPAALPVRASVPAQTAPTVPPAPVTSTPAPQPAVPPESEAASAAIPAHLEGPTLLGPCS